MYSVFSALATAYPGRNLRRMYKTAVRGCEFSLEFRQFFLDDGDQLISPMHDIPLLANQERRWFNMVVEVPRWSCAKMEISTKEPLTPVKQDVKKGRPRFVHSCFPYRGYLWNYGALPQTWEDPDHLDPRTDARGDNDPLDVCEIGSKVGLRGQVKQVKVLGALALIDEGETDWKLLAVDVTDPLADQLNTLEDVDRVMPGMLQHSFRWFQIYKIPAGKPPNQFGLEGKFQSAEFARGVIEETHAQWKRLIGGEVKGSGGLDLRNTTLQGSPGFIGQSEARAVLDGHPAPGPPAPVPESADSVDFVKDP